MAGVDFAIIIEKTGTGYSAYVPDLPGCVAAGETLDETRKLMHEAINLHLELMRERGEEIPRPTSIAETVRVA